MLESRLYPVIYPDYSTGWREPKSNSGRLRGVAARRSMTDHQRRWSVLPAWPLRLSGRGGRTRGFVVHGGEEIASAGRRADVQAFAADFHEAEGTVVAQVRSEDRRGGQER